MQIANFRKLTWNKDYEYSDKNWQMSRIATGSVYSRLVSQCNLVHLTYLIELELNKNNPQKLLIDTLFGDQLRNPT